MRPGGPGKVAVQTRAQLIISRSYILPSLLTVQHFKKKHEIHLNTLIMPAPQTPVATPVTFSFDNGEIQLTSVIDPETRQHLVTVDLCNQVIKLGIRGSIGPISLHRDSEKCKRWVFKVSNLNSKNRNLVSEAIQIMAFSDSDQLMLGW